jgi:hypothetical protein
MGGFIGACDVLGCLVQSQKFTNNQISDFFWRFLLISRLQKFITIVGLQAKERFNLWESIRRERLLRYKLMDQTFDEVDM